MGFNIVEFNGIPGSGKTTISKELEKILKNKNLKIINEKEVFNANNKLKSLFCLKNTAINFMIVFLAVDIAIRNQKRDVLLNAFKIIRYNNIIYKSYKNKDFDYMILSEGMIQFISLLFDNKKYNKQKFISKIAKRLSRIYSNILYINCEIEEKVAFSRISNRISKPNSIDLMDKNKLKIFLKERKYNIENIRKNFNCFNHNITLNTENPIDDSIKLILNKIDLGG